jgi:hypothetical protein
MKISEVERLDANAICDLWRACAPMQTVLPTATIHIDTVSLTWELVTHKKNISGAHPKTIILNRPAGSTSRSLPALQSASLQVNGTSSRQGSTPRP